MARRDQVHLGALPAPHGGMHAALLALIAGQRCARLFQRHRSGAVRSALCRAGDGRIAKADNGGSSATTASLRGDGAVVIADTGFVPSRPFALRAHAGAQAFEFSHGTELIVGNCGPAPAELRDQGRLFRLGAAHSAPSVDHRSSAILPTRGRDAGTLIASGPQPELEIDTAEQVLKLTSHAFEASAGVTLERWLTLLMGGETLVGQDRVTAAGSGITGHGLTLRFHLGPGVEAERQQGEDIIRLRLPSGRHWSFLWEGATAEIDESVRQSAYYGFYRTRQIVLNAALVHGLEIAWILTRLA